MSALKVVMFVLPQEIDLLETTLIQLKRNSLFLGPSQKVILDITLCLSDELTNWEESKLPMEYFENKFEYLKRYADWCQYNFSVERGSTILGCVSKRREAVKAFQGEDAYLWLDCDMVFPDHTLHMIFSSMDVVSQTSQYYVITPQLVKIWDDTWDALVNEEFLNMPHNFNQLCDIYSIAFDPNRTGLEIRSMPRGFFKFAGGWVTVVSRGLLEKAPIPESLGHYGLEDYFVMNAANLLTNLYSCQQYLIKGLVVGENHRYRDDSYITKFLATKDRKDEFRQVAWQNIRGELQKLVEAMTT